MHEPVVQSGLKIKGDGTSIFSAWDEAENTKPLVPLSLFGYVISIDFDVSDSPRELARELIASP